MTESTPYICMDRMQWADAKRGEIGHAFHERWREHAPILGWYDYIYGSRYKAPRVYCHLMADYLRYAKRNGVRAYYAEAYPPSVPNWGEGPKLYVTSRLLWNPDLDIDALLRDWYACFAAEAAAEHLTENYAYWEEFWTRRSAFWRDRVDREFRNPPRQNVSACQRAQTGRTGSGDPRQAGTIRDETLVYGSRGTANASD
jgi:hypothetical protein